MIYDKKSRILAALMLALMLALPFASSAQSKFPFTVTRDASGTLSRIDLPSRTTILSGDEDTLTVLKRSLADLQANKIESMGAAEMAPPNADDKKVYEQAKTFLKQDLSLSTLNDNRLETEYVSAKSKLLKIELFRLLAAPNMPSAFDRESIVADAISAILSQAGTVLGASPVYDVLHFLVEQYVEALESRRAFYQNQLLSLIANDPSLFADKEKDLIRSSIFYSRISVINIPARDKAKKAWATYGNTQLASLLKPCKDFVRKNEKGFGPCFKVSGTQIVNKMVKKALFTKSASLAFDSKNTTRVRDTRAALILAKLGLALLPVPGLAKKPVSVWLSSQYIEQRKSEGFLFENALWQGQDTLAHWVIVNSANPIISK